MIHDLLLLPMHPNGFPALSIVWDEDVGAIAGRDAERALEFVENAKASGWVAIHPIPSGHPLSAEPLRSRPDMAAIFGQWFILPAFLEEVMPVGQSDDDVNEGGVDVLYSGASASAGNDFKAAPHVDPCCNLPALDEDDPLIAHGRRELDGPLKWG